MSLNIIDIHDGIEVRTAGTDYNYLSTVTRLSDGYVSLAAPTTNEASAHSQHAHYWANVQAGKVGVFDTVVEDDGA